MTISEFLNRVPKMRSTDGTTTLRQAMMDTVDIWSNEACEGYCLWAMRRAGLSQDQIAAVISELHEGFRTVSVEAAEQGC